ncbi:hypothetical protein [Brassicibacter mesophilus]|uniref:hypothetical protein n=1 Tax=Brassicibacter mesophilus TaxID=745119 RepID=UPI003D1D216E
MSTKMIRLHFNIKRAIEYLTIFLMILFFLLGCTNKHLSDSKGIKGSFSDFVLPYYSSEQFDNVNIEKLVGNKYIVKFSNDNEKITSEFLNYFRQLQLEKVEYKDFPETTFLKEVYEVNFKNKETYAKMKIQIFDKTYIDVINFTHEKITDKKRNMVTYKRKIDSQTYKICNSELDFEYIEDVFSSLDSKKE